MNLKLDRNVYQYLQGRYITELVTSCLCLSAVRMMLLNFVFYQCVTLFCQIFDMGKQILYETENRLYTMFTQIWKPLLFVVYT